METFSSSLNEFGKKKQMVVWKVIIGNTEV